MSTSELSTPRHLILYHSLSLSFIALILSALSFLIGVTAGYLYSKYRRLVPLILGRWLGEVIILAIIYFP